MLIEYFLHTENLSTPSRATIVVRTQGQNSVFDDLEAHLSECRMLVTNTQ